MKIYKIPANVNIFMNNKNPNIIYIILYLSAWFGFFSLVKCGFLVLVRFNFTESSFHRFLFQFRFGFFVQPYVCVFLVIVLCRF